MKNLKELKEELKKLEDEAIYCIQKIEILDEYYLLVLAGYKSYKPPESLKQEDLALYKQAEKHHRGVIIAIEELQERIKVLEQ